jgi:hypothetical protein
VLVAGLLGAALLAAAGPAAAVNGGACKRPYAPAITPSAFTDAAGAPNRIDNPYFPLEPGTTFVYEGIKDGAPLRDVMTVTSDTRTIMGIVVTVVRDTAYSDGLLAEDTFDWYAQDDAGNVWYFGEDTRAFDEDGNVETTFGSWEAGVGDNLPGILMLAHPRGGTTYRQEYAPDVAVDMATVLSRSRHLTVPAGTYGGVVLTKEFSCLESGADHKFYAPGVGLLREAAVSGGAEWISLVSVTH